MPQKTNLATSLQTELMKRMNMITKNPMMVCAVFLDRRYSSELKTEEKSFAIMTLMKIWNQIRSEHTENMDTSIDDSGDNDGIGAQQFEYRNNDSVLEDYFSFKGVGLDSHIQLKNDKPNFSMCGAEIYDILVDFDSKTGRQPTSKNVIEYWEEQKLNYPEIYLLSTIINAIPPTQASTERCFSSLNFIYDEKRSSLSLILLEQILIIRLNRELVLQIFSDDLEIIEQKSS